MNNTLGRTCTGLLVCLLICTTGCMSSRITSPEQTAVEQLLLSTAADRAVDRMSFDLLDDRKVYLDVQYLDSYRREYLTGALRDALGSAGAHLTEDRLDADIIAEPRASALSIDETDALLGIPSMAIPVPLSGGLSIPELALYKKHKQNAIGKLSVHCYDRTREQTVASIGPTVGRAYYNRWSLLFLITFRTTDLPEK